MDKVVAMLWVWIGFPVLVIMLPMAFIIEQPGPDLLGQLSAIVSILTWGGGVGYLMDREGAR